MKKIKKLLAIMLAFALVFAIAGCGKEEEAVEEAPAAEEAEVINIGILQLVEHAALDASREGFIAALADNGFVDGENIAIDFQNAQNDQANLKTISQRFVQNDVDLVLAIATPAVQSIAAETTEIPILGTAVTDYVAASLVDSNEVPGGNVSGTTDLTPVAKQIELLAEMFPDAATIGIMYNSSEVNSEIQADMAIAAIEDLGLAYEVGTVTSTNDIDQVARSLANKVDAFYIPTDNTFASAIATVGTISDEFDIPVIVGESGMLSGGGVATLGIDYYKLGYQTGEMAVRIFNEGAVPAEMPIEGQGLEDAELAINLDMAKAIGYEVPDEIMERAASVIENGETVAK